MPDSNETWSEAPAEPGLTAPEPAAEPAPPPPPQYVTREAFEQSQAETRQVLSALNETMSYLRAGMAQPRAPQAPPQHRVTRAQFIEAMQTGDEKVIEAYERQQEQSWVETHVVPLRDTGLEAIATLRQEASMARLPYAARFKKEIDQFMAALPPAMRMNDEVFRTAHNAVVGAHAQELLAEERERAMRAGTEPPAESADAGRRGRGSSRSADSTPTVEDIGGMQAVAALQGKGQDADAFARRLGYKGWRDYIDVTNKVTGG